jgi:transposase
MIKVDDKEVMRRKFYLEGQSMRQIAREQHCSRDTVKRALVEPAPTVYHLHEPRPSPVMGRCQALIDQWLLEDQQRPAKQRHTAHRIYERLAGEPYHFTGAESTVRRFVRERKAALGLAQPAAFIPLEFGPGQDAQADFGEAQVIVAGQQVTVQYLVVVLCYSTLPFVMAFPHQRQEAFFEGHVAAFQFFGGVPRRIWYDNLRAAVRRVLEGRSRQEQQAFIGLRSHYLFESRFCTPGQGHEKGLVEALVGQSRRNFMVPLPQAATWAELNAQLLARCEQEKLRCRHGETQTIGERWGAEGEHLLSLPATPFEACVHATGHVNSQRLVSFDGNAYSVPLNPSHERGGVLIKGFVHRVVIIRQGQPVAEHPRCYGKGQEILDPLHYLDLLAQRPGAFEHAKPIRRWRENWPPVYERYLAALRQRLDEPEAVRRFVQVLRLHSEFPAPAVEAAVQRAVAADCLHPDGVRQLVLVRTDSPPVALPLDLGHRPELAQTPVRAPDLARYNQLVVQEA